MKLKHKPKEHLDLMDRGFKLFDVRKGYFKIKEKEIMTPVFYYYKANCNINFIQPGIYIIISKHSYREYKG